MKGDFSRTTFDPAKHFSRVLMQQGRVQLDADWNEQGAILLHYLRTLARDLYGPHGGPAGQACGFAVIPDANVANNFRIGPGHYYVDGILCENEGDYWYQAAAGIQDRQPDYVPAPEERLESFGQNNRGDSLLVYLDVWERHISAVEDDSIREKALGGPDTATRARVVWQVKVMRVAGGGGKNDDERAQLEMELKIAGEKKAELEVKLKQAKDRKEIEELQLAIKELDEIVAAIEAKLKEGGGAALSCDELVATLPKLSQARLRARVKPTQPSTDPCIQAPDARYRGAENQLYRVEIHDGGSADAGATFKWSRDNGAVVFPIVELNGTVATLAHLGRDQRLGLQVGDWVELVDDNVTLHGDAGPLLQVDAVDPVEMAVTLKNPANTALPVYDQDSATHPYVRRWDHKGSKAMPLTHGALPVVEGEVKDGWLDLEDGVQVRFEPKGVYRSGDYWLIPARTATGKVEWPLVNGEPKARKPHGVEHHYAPLARITVAASAVSVDEDCRCAITLGRQCPP